MKRNRLFDEFRHTVDCQKVNQELHKFDSEYAHHHDRYMRESKDLR